MTGVLEVGGTHLTGAVVNADWTVTGHLHLDLDAHGTAESLLAAFADTAAALGEPLAAVALPSPFDYSRGIALYDAAVGKFEALHGVDLRAALGADVVFLNDADAFALGAWWQRGAPDVDRLVGLTLGTGVGAGWISGGAVITSGPDVPEDGMAHVLFCDGAPLEDTMSRRALRRAYLERTGIDADVLEITDRARDDEAVARGVLRHALGGLGETIGPWLLRFGAERVVVGGSISRSWDLLGPWFAEGCSMAGVSLPVTALDDPDAAFVGAAYAAHP